MDGAQVDFLGGPIPLVTRQQPSGSHPCWATMHSNQAGLETFYCCQV